MVTGSRQARPAWSHEPQTGSRRDLETRPYPRVGRACRDPVRPTDAAGRHPSTGSPGLDRLDQRGGREPQIGSRRDLVSRTYPHVGRACRDPVRRPTDAAADCRKQGHRISTGSTCVGAATADRVASRARDGDRGRLTEGVCRAHRDRAALRQRRARGGVRGFHAQQRGDGIRTRVVAELEAQVSQGVLGL
jgi:hypothetical protein